MTGTFKHPRSHGPYGPYGSYGARGSGALPLQETAQRLGEQANNMMDLLMALGRARLVIRMTLTTGDPHTVRVRHVARAALIVLETVGSFPYTIFTTPGEVVSVAVLSEDQEAETTGDPATGGTVALAPEIEERDPERIYPMEGGEGQRGDTGQRGDSGEDAP